MGRHWVESSAFITFFYTYTFSHNSKFLLTTDCIFLLNAVYMYVTYTLQTGESNLNLSCWRLLFSTFFLDCETFLILFVQPK